MTKADPELRQIVDEGIEIEKAWLADNSKPLVTWGG